TLECVSDTGLLAPGEQRSHLNAGGAGIECPAQSFGRAGAAREPEGTLELQQSVDVDFVALAVLRFAPLVQPQLTAWWRVVTASRRTFHHEAIHAPVRLAGERGGQRVCGHDRQESRTGERCAVIGSMRTR